MISFICWEIKHRIQNQLSYLIFLIFSLTNSSMQENIVRKKQIKLNRYLWDSNKNKSLWSNKAEKVIWKSYYSI